MNCWHCSKELVLDFQGAEYERVYHCENCDSWYEMRKDKVRPNAAVPVRFFELENRPQYSMNAGV